MRVSVMIDTHGANTTAAAAVLCAKKHMSLAGATATVLAATGSVGRRAVRLLAREGASVRVASRKISRAMELCDDPAILPKDTKFEAWETSDESSTRSALDGADLLIAAGAPGVEVVSDKIRQQSKSLRVVIDLNAVPPFGVGGINPQDKAVERDGQTCYGAIGVGGTKMKLHKAAIRRLFEQNDLILDADEIFDLGGKI
jgi:hypothetical protein